MKKWFTTHGIPEILESDGGPQFTSNTFKQFASCWQFDHRISSPHYARSNGFAERNIQTIKNMLRKCHHDDTDVYEALLILRNTPRNNELGSQCQRLFSRNIKTFIPIGKEQLIPKIINNVTRELARDFNKKCILIKSQVRSNNWKLARESVCKQDPGNGNQQRSSEKQVIHDQ